MLNTRSPISGGWLFLRTRSIILTLAGKAEINGVACESPSGMGSQSSSQKIPLAPNAPSRHLIAAMINSVQLCASACVNMTTVKRARWHGLAWRRWSCAEIKRHG
jgi:hypothetical protein